MSLQKRKVGVYIMTIAEIKNNIKYLQGVLKEKESELENQKDDMVGRYYKSGDAIGRIIKKDQHGDGEYICNEVYFFNSESYGESFEHDNCATNSISELELIPKEEFERCFDKRIRKLKRLFLPE
jgi:hypothetical protein